MKSIGQTSLDFHNGFQNDDGTNDLLVSDVIRANEFQVRFLAEHRVA